MVQRFTAIALGMWCIASSPARAIERHVPAQYPTIQLAIDASTRGDVVVVAPGAYAEAIDFRNLSITVRASEGPEHTVLDATGHASSAVTCASTMQPSEATLEGFTVTGGVGRLMNGIRVGGAIYA